MLFHAHQFDDGSRWLLCQYQRVSTHGKFVPIARAPDGERALCHHGFCCEHIAGYRVRTGIEVKGIEDRDLFGVGCLVI